MAGLIYSGDRRVSGQEHKRARDRKRYVRPNQIPLRRDRLPAERAPCVHLSPGPGARFRFPREAQVRSVAQEAKNKPGVDWQERIYRGVLRRLRNIWRLGQIRA